MKKISIKPVESAPTKLDSSASIISACAFVLTKLTQESNATVFVKWDPGEEKATWLLSESFDFFEKPNSTVELICVRNLALFRSMLARLGDATTGCTYLGAGTFVVSFDGDPSSNKYFAMFFSNWKQTGFWAKMQLAGDISELDTPTNAPNVPRK